MCFCEESPSLLFVRSYLTVLLSLGFGVAVTGCGDDSNPMTMTDASMGVDAAVMADGGTDSDAGMNPDGGVGPIACAAPSEPALCEPNPTDYTPGEDDMWPECVSDSGEYTRIQDTISTIARVQGFERIATMLFDPTRDPTADEFLAARMIYQEDEGLDSRVVRRYDPRFSVPEGTDCTQPGVAEMHRDYCVGPGRLQPLILDAFGHALNDDDSSAPVRVEAARIEAALLWFLYASTNKEAYSCTTKPKDCDSAYAYYTGGADAREGIGLARYVNQADPAAHSRVWDGIFAVRCWRDLDQAEPAENLELRDRARAQLDQAVTHGLAAIINSRLDELCAATGAEAAYHWAFIRTLGPALYGTAGDDAAATVLRTEFAKFDAETVDLEMLRGALDQLYPCP